MIVGEIKRFLRDDGMLKVSRSLKETAYKARMLKEELIKEFNEKHCPGCPSYPFCGGEIILACKAFNKFLNEKV